MALNRAAAKSSSLRCLKETAESCKAKRSSSKCLSSTSLSSSTTLASSSTASIVSLAEGEAATSSVLQDDVSSVLGVEGDKLLADQDAANARVPAAMDDDGKYDSDVEDACQFDARRRC